jgi:hypothetical protein
MFSDPKERRDSMATQTATRLAAWPVYLEEELQAVPEVVGAFAALDRNAVRLIIFVSEYNDTVLNRVLDIEDRFASLYREGTFLFDILAAPKGGSPATVVPGAKQIYYTSAVSA